MKQISVNQLLRVSSLIAAFFWIYAFFKNNFQIAQLITDFQVSWIPLVVNFAILIIWLALFTLLYRITNNRYLIWKILIYLIGMYLSLLAFDLFFVPFHYVLDSLGLYAKSGLLSAFNIAIHNYLIYCIALIFISHEFQFILCNKSSKLAMRLSWLILMIIVLFYFIIRRYIF